MKNTKIKGGKEEKTRYVDTATLQIKVVDEKVPHTGDRHRTGVLQATINEHRIALENVALIYNVLYRPYSTVKGTIFALLN